MSNDFILIKNKDGSGKLLLRVEQIQSVSDRSERSRENGEPGNSSIRCREDDGAPTWYDSESTAAEVLAAIQEAQNPQLVVGTMTDPLGRAYRFEHGKTYTAQDALGEALAAIGRIAEDRVALKETRAQVGSCTCPHRLGDNPACPVHGVGTAWHDLHGGMR